MRINPHLMKNKASILRGVLLSVLFAANGLFLSSCATNPRGMVSAVSESSRVGASSRQRERPGLGTKAGWERHDEVERTTFYRKSSSPDAVASFYYNDEAGAKAMADLLGGGSRRGGLFDVAGDRLRVGLDSGYNDICPRLDTGTRQIVMGRPGQTYSIRIENRSSQRVEVVVSVDGLNVLTGTAAAPTQSGYVIAPRGLALISGFRVSDSRVRSFEFSSVAASEAAARGQARNVGVVGIAVFEEDEAKKKM